jgi:hypothetical protein
MVRLPELDVTEARDVLMKRCECRRRDHRQVCVARDEAAL